jgi:predicted HTH transcriptional regulator
LANGRDRIEATPVHQALREALANCLINADYYGETGVVVKNEAEQITFDNPGVLRIPLDVALCGGVSSPRNAGLMKMFNLLNIGERAGSGIPNILRVWHDQRWTPPTLQSFYTPEHAVLTVRVPSQQTTKNADKKCRQKSADKKVPTKSAGQRQAILAFMKTNHEIRSADLLPVLNVGERRIKVLLQSLVASNKIQTRGANKNRTYRLM